MPALGKAGGATPLVALLPRLKHTTRALFPPAGLGRPQPRPSPGAGAVVFAVFTRTWCVVRGTGTARADCRLPEVRGRLGLPGPEVGLAPSPTASPQLLPIPDSSCRFGSSYAALVLYVIYIFATRRSPLFLSLFESLAACANRT
jgi:hypothetical protein